MAEFIPIAVALGLTGLFASRVFVPMFAAAMVLRLGIDEQMFGQLGLLQSISADTVPNWFTSDTTLIVLGALAAAELLAHKSNGLRELLSNVDQYGKPAAAALTYFGVMSFSDQDFLERFMVEAGMGDYFLAGFVVLGTFLVAASHNYIFRTWIEVDEDNDSGVIGLFSWGQDLWSVFGILLLLLFPLVMAGLILLGCGLIFLLRKRAEWQEERSKGACPSCGQPMYRSAIGCANCGNANPAPCGLTWLGASTHWPVYDRQHHAMDLVAKKRCPWCATRLRERVLRQSCPTCRTQPFDAPGFVHAYDRMVSSRLGGVLVLCAVLSLVPIFGLLIGAIYYRMALVAPYRRYIGRGRSFLLRWCVRVLFFFLMLLQLVPGLGMVVVPLMALISYNVYRGSFLKRVREMLPPQYPAPPPVVAGQS